jgi:hypothetical protein
MAALATLMIGLGLIIRWGQLRLRASYLTGRIAASIAGVITLPVVMPLLGARSMNEVRTYVMGGAFGFMGFWLAVKLWQPAGRTGRRR